jgi:predicted small secreted protein
MQIKKIAITILGALTLLLFVQGCHTMQGAGEDMERAGEEVQDAAQ